MTEEKITYEDFREYEFVFGKVPSLLLGTMIRRNANLVGKFESVIKSKLTKLNEKQKKQLNMVLNADVSELQKVLKEGYEKTGKKQYKQLSEPKAAKFITKNIIELKKLIKNIQQ